MHIISVSWCGFLTLYLYLRDDSLAQSTMVVTMKVAAMAARTAMAVKQVVAIVRVEQGAEPLGSMVATGSEVVVEVAPVM